ncbi:hypothetical protein FHX12_004313 [Rhizobium sp. BK609]|nr:hypothetical protein [Rhizobium sp. BK098]MBB3567354.1 hypothetical protein [Rhizobium sp. BK491]MBB3617320.1 hypothetical protein [Rhizobium sp. BK609]MBB3682844.1 hypothetical protein [Rhizobium sp. BK612]
MDLNFVKLTLGKPSCGTYVAWRPEQTFLKGRRTCLPLWTAIFFNNLV